MYELNEIPQKVFDFYADAFPNSAFATLRQFGQLTQTVTADVGHLSPWVTWPTLHRGVSNVMHEISDLGQDLCEVNKAFPSVHQLLANNGVKVGVFGSLQSYPLPNNLENYAFYVPDTFAAGPECFPKQLSDFQAFNLSMVKRNGRNVSSGIAVKGALKFIQSSLRMGMKTSTVFNIAQQLLVERFNSDRVVRRRSSQAEISFDLYFQQLTTEQPDISFFFTNHLASSLHRYWPSVFPEDYDEGKFDKGWLMKWSEEIPHAVRVANHQLEKLINFCNATQTELIVCSSMGQAAVKNVKKVDREVLITNLKSLLRYCGIKDNEWEPRLSMAPRVVFKPLNESIHSKLALMENLSINGRKINSNITSTGDIMLDFQLVNVSEIEVLDNGKKLNPSVVGLQIIDIQDASAAYAYHTPKGILIYYRPDCRNLLSGDQLWKSSSVLDIAPSLLNSFGCDIPSYMNGEKDAFQYAN